VREERDDTYWARQLTVATVLGFVVFVVTFLSGCVAFLSYFNYVNREGTASTMRSFFLSLAIALVVAGMAFGAVMWRGKVRRSRELAEND
jgi:Fe2+ transport system protein B